MRSLRPTLHLICELVAGKYSGEKFNVVKSKVPKDLLLKGYKMNYLIGSNEVAVKFLNIENQKVNYIFCVSLNEEHVEIIVHKNQMLYSLGIKVHHYILLILARKMIEYKAVGFPKQEWGWISKHRLIDMLKINANYLNIQIYRAKKSVSVIDDALSKRLFQSRPGEVRLGPTELIIDKCGMIIKSSNGSNFTDALM